MKMCKPIIAMLAVAFLSSAASSEAEAVKDLKIGVINFKQAVERSKLGQQEQASFEALKKQAEQILQEKEKLMTELAKKLEDPDYLDSLSPEAEAELKHKFRVNSQEMEMHQKQLYQTLTQSNFKIVQKLTDTLNQAAKKVAAKDNLDLIVNEEACFFYANTLDKTEDAIKAMDESSSK